MISLGQYQTLRIVGRDERGLYLDGGKEGHILMPAKYAPRDAKDGDEIEVLVYLDQEERPIATTERPLVTVGGFACLEVAWVNEYGAFLHWGPLKDLFCPFREQKMRMMKGQRYIIRCMVDEDSYRLMATAKVDKWLDRERPHYKHGDPVDALIWQKTPLGFKVIVDNAYSGQLYDNQIFRPLTTGDRLTAYIDHVRQDGKLDLTLQPTGHAREEEFAPTLLDYLKAHGGHCPIGDKSPAEDIYNTFQVSKKTFKRAIGDLYRQRLITITDDGLRLC